MVDNGETGQAVALTQKQRPACAVPLSAPIKPVHRPGNYLCVLITTDIAYQPRGVDPANRSFSSLRLFQAIIITHLVG